MSRGLIIFCLLSCFNLSVAFAQTKYPVDIETFCRKNKIAIICDHYPKGELDTKFLLDNSEKQKVTLQNGVYSVHFTENVNILPSVSHVEIQRFLSAILDLYGQVEIIDDSNITDIVLVQNFISSLSTEDMEKIKDGIKLQNISSKSKDPLLKFIIRNNLKILNSFSCVYRLVKTTKNPNSIFRYFHTSPESTKILGMEGLFGPTGVSWQFLIGHGFVFQNTGLSYRRMPDGKLLVVGVFPESDEQKSILKQTTEQLSNLPNINDETEPFFAEKTHTLGEFIKYINQHNNNSTTYITDDYISQKPIFIFGSNYVSVKSLIKSVADFYELDLRAIGNNKIRLTKKKNPLIKDRSEVYKHISQLIPVDIRRWLIDIDAIIQKKNKNIVKNNDSEDVPIPSKLNTLIQKGQQNSQRLSLVSGISRDLIIKQIKNELSAYMQKNAGRRVKINESPLHLQNLLSLLFFINELELINFILNPHDEYKEWMKSFDELNIKGDVSSDKKKINFYINSPYNKIISAHSFIFP